MDVPFQGGMLIWIGMLILIGTLIQKSTTDMSNDSPIRIMSAKYLDNIKAKTATVFA